MITGRMYRLEVDNGCNDDDYYLIKLDNGNYLVIWELYPNFDKEDGCIVYLKDKVEKNIENKKWKIVELSDDKHDSFVSHHKR